jgi:O-antigen/teichoic acid export membrane protein
MQFMDALYLRAVICRMVGTASSLVAGTISLRLYGQYLTPEIYGTIIVPLQVMNYLPLLDGGFRTVVNRTILANSRSEEILGTIKFCQAFYSLFALLVLAVAELCMVGYSLIPAGANAGEPLTFFLALGLVGALSVVASAQMSLLIALGSHGQMYLITALNSWLMVGALWLGLLTGEGIWAFPLSGAAALLVTFPLALALIRRHVPTIRFFGFQVDAEFWRYFNRFKFDAWSCFRSEVAVLVLFSVDIVFVGLLCGPKDAAGYGVLSRLFGIVRAFVQSSGEAAWPVIAQQGGIERSALGRNLIRMNAWIYGGITGSAAVVLYPFLHWYMGEGWVASSTVLYAVALRFLVTGMASNVTYLLYGLGEFHILRRYLERELCASVVFALALGSTFGVEGIGIGFLGATSFGTLFPIIHAYAKRSAIPTWKLLGDMWWRALVALVSAGSTAALLRGYSSGIRFIGIGLFSFLVAITLGYLISFLRFRRDSEGTLLKTNLYFYLKNM